MSDFDASNEELEQLSLPEIEETIGEIQRRIAVALRALGEQAADEPGPEGRAPRLEVAELAARLELAALALAALAGGDTPVAEPAPRLPALAAALMYAAPTIPALLQRLEQDRRLLASLARTAGERAVPDDGRAVRRLLVESGLGAAARCVMALEAALERHAEDPEQEAGARAGP